MGISLHLNLYAGMKHLMLGPGRFPESTTALEFYTWAFSLAIESAILRTHVDEEEMRSLLHGGNDEDNLFVRRSFREQSLAAFKTLKLMKHPGRPEVSCSLVRRVLLVHGIAVYSALRVVRKIWGNPSILRDARGQKSTDDSNGDHENAVRDGGEKRKVRRREDEEESQSPHTHDSIVAEGEAETKVFSFARAVLTNKSVENVIMTLLHFLLLDLFHEMVWLPLLEHFEIYDVQKR